MSRKKVRPRQPKGQAKEQAGERVYPSPAERARIIRRRDQLLDQLLKVLVMQAGDPRRIDRLILKYGPQDVAVVVSAIQRRSEEVQFIGDESVIYRGYRHTFARFGGDRPFLTIKEYAELASEHARLYNQRQHKPVIRRRPGARERELEGLLLGGATLWEDITPPAVPPRPADLNAPAPGNYGYPVRALLGWGWDLDEERLAHNARNVTKWRQAVPDLVRMALDAGLLDGWPGEPSSWAPYHALHMLGHIGAHQAAGRLLSLFEQENDWLSDRLAVVWGQMGPQAEPPLWDYASDARHEPEHRAVVFLGLALVAENYAGRRGHIVNRLAGLLQSASAGDREANAYLVHVLHRLHAVEAADIIAGAFDQGKVDDSIIAPYDLEFLEDRDGRST